MYNIALIGCGYWGSKLKKYIELSPFFNLVYICDSNFSLSKIWMNEDIKAVVVATPQETHYKIVKEALLSGKNVLSEKPLTLSGEEANELQKLAHDKKCDLVVEYTYTFSQGLQRVKQLVNEGAIGKIFSFQLSMNRFGRFGRGHVYWLLGSHMLSILNMFCQIENLKYTSIEMFSSKYGVETGHILFHNDFQIGGISVSLNYPGKETKVVLNGELGSIKYDDQNHPTITIKKYGKDESLIENLDFDENNNLQYSIEYFIDVLQERQKGNIDVAVKISDILCKYV